MCAARIGLTNSAIYLPRSYFTGSCIIGQLVATDTSPWCCQHLICCVKDETPLGLGDCPFLALTGVSSPPYEIVYPFDKKEKSYQRLMLFSFQGLPALICYSTRDTSSFTLRGSICLMWLCMSTGVLCNGHKLVAPKSEHLFLHYLCLRWNKSYNCNLVLPRLDHGLSRVIFLCVYRLQLDIGYNPVLG